MQVIKNGKRISIKDIKNEYSVASPDLVITQYDSGIEIHFVDDIEITEVQCAVQGQSAIRKLPSTEKNVFKLPNALTELGKQLLVYVMFIGEDFSITEKRVIIKVKEREVAEDVVSKEDEPDFREEMQKIMDVIKAIAQSVRKDADQGKFDGVKGDKGDDYVLTEADKKEIADMVEVEGGGYSRTEIDTKLGSKITLYSGTTAPSTSPSAYPDFVEPSLYYDKSTKKIYTLFSAGGSAIIAFKHLNENDVANKTNSYKGAGVPTSKLSDYPNAKVGDIYVDTNDYMKFYMVMSVNESSDYIWWVSCPRELLLQSYYVQHNTLTNNYYNKTQTEALLNAITTLSLETVLKLPTENISTLKIYLVPRVNADGKNNYEEWINLDGTVDGWEFIGTTEVDLSNYPTIDDMNTAIENSIGDINTVLASLVDVESEV